MSKTNSDAFMSTEVQTATLALLSALEQQDVHTKKITVTLEAPRQVKRIGTLWNVVDFEEV